MSIRTIAIPFFFLAVAAGCARLVPVSGSGSREHVDRQAHYALTVPGGWSDSRDAAAATEKLRLRSPGGRAFVSIAVVPLGSSTCRLAIESWLSGKAIAFTTTVDRTGRIASGEVPTVTGEIEELRGGDSGALSAFCDEGTAVIAFGLAESGLTSDGRAEMGALISSLRFFDPSPARPTPTVSAKRAVRPTPSIERKAPPPRRPEPKPKKPVAAPTPVPVPTREPEPPPAPEPAPPEEDDEIVPAR